jgi:hypothetical protein
MSFNKEQLDFINSDICDCVVYGNPGCGKTTSIIEYVINKNVKSKEFLIISFSKQAQIDFISRAKNKCDIFNNINVRTIHSVAYAIITKILGKSSTMHAAVILSAYKNIEKYNFDLNTISFLSKCKFIIVDEAQDINIYQYELITLIAKKLNIPLILVGDPNQNIYQFQGGDDKYLLNHSNKKYNLIKNYRSTKQIIDFCNYIRPHEILPMMEVGNLNLTGIKPIVISRTNDDILQNIKDEILKGHYKYHEIAIIGSVKLSKEYYDITNNEYKVIYKSLGLNQVCNFLNKHGINFVKYYKDGNNIDFDNNDKIEAKEGHVNILTAHSSKGLEFKKVLIINYHFETFSKKPTLEDYNKFKYLWYVAFTRAKNELIIYVNNDKYVFSEIEKIPKDNYIKIGDKLKINTESYSTDIKPFIFSITDFINSNKYCNEEVLYELENNYSYSKTSDILFNIEINENEIYEHNSYQLLYGKFIEELFVYNYYKNNINYQSYITKCINKLENTILIDKTDIKYTHILKILGYITLVGKCLILYTNIDKSKLDVAIQQYNKNNEDKNYFKQLDSSEIFNFIQECKNKVSIDCEYINILFENNLYEYDKNKLLKLIRSIIDNDTNNMNEQIIFNIVLYYYQIENECMYILKNDFSKHLASIKHYYNKISNLTLNKSNYEFQVFSRNNHINIIGILDILHNDDTIIELKFCKYINYKHILQLLLYNNNYYFNKKMEIWNLYDGKKYIINFYGDVWKFNCYLSTIIETKMTNNIFLLDIETNTINNTIDFTEPKNTEIIDRYVYEYNFNYCISSGLIKNNHKLTTTHITGITEKDLLTAENLDKFKKEIVELIMKYCDKPIFIAHNGTRFDFPILYYHEILNKTEIKTLDTVNICRLFIKDKISNKLIDIYNYLYDDIITQTHRAKEDTILLKKILNKLNLTLYDLIYL